MPDFLYIARNPAGQKVSGTMEADSEASVLRMLDDRRLFPVQVAPAPRARSMPGSRRVKTRDVGQMYGQLADLIGSGVPLLRAIDSLVRSTPSARLVELLKEIHASVADGKSLADSMRAHPEVFPPLHTVMVQAGERASFLQDVLASLSGFLERLDELRSKVLGALIYPALLVGVGGLVMLMALVFFVPKFEPLMEGMDKPLPTALVFGMSGLVRNYWPFVLLALVGLGSMLWSAIKSEAGKQAFERWRLKIPVVGMALRMVAITRFCRILGTMLANGVPLLQALAISKDATGSSLMGQVIAEAAEAVRAGQALTGPLAQGGLFPQQIVSMIAVAEESNQLEKVLIQIADTVERRTNRQVDHAVRLVEPLILCMVAAGIGFLALGLLIPIFTMASSLGGK